MTFNASLSNYPKRYLWYATEWAEAFLILARVGAMTDVHIRSSVTWAHGPLTYHVIYFMHIKTTFYSSSTRCVKAEGHWSTRTPSNNSRHFTTSSQTKRQVLQGNILILPIGEGKKPNTLSAIENLPSTDLSDSPLSIQALIILIVRVSGGIKIWWENEGPRY
jgi:hypothetical protein